MKSIRKPSSGDSRCLSAFSAVTVGLLVAGTSAASWAAVHAQLERTTVEDGDTLTLSIDSDAAQSEERPDLNPLHKDFEVLGTTTSSETRFINGSRSDHTRWLVQLQPRHAGTITVPPISVGGEHTATLELEVAETSPQTARHASAHAFLEAEASAADKPIYVQQQIPYVIRLYYDDTVQKGELSPPDPPEAIVEQLGDEKRYTTTRDGHEYHVIERRYAIAPEHSGALNIPPATFRGTAIDVDGSEGAGDPEDDPMARFLRNTPLANNPFFRRSLSSAMAFGIAGQPIAARSPALAFQVQPRPPAAQGNWLPAEEIILHDSWQDTTPQFKVGEPVTRTITIEAKGLAASQIPSLSLTPPSTARLYTEASDNQSRTDGAAIYGISKQTVTYIATAPGTLAVPPVELAWWDTRSDAQALAQLPAHEYKVAPGAAMAQSNAPSPGIAGEVPRVASPVAATTSAGQNLSLIGRLRNRELWLAGGAALLAMTILFVVYIRRSHRARSIQREDTAANPPLPGRKLAMRALRHACRANDARTAARALLDVGHTEWPDDPPCTLGALAARLEAGGDEISALDRHLYGALGTGWEGATLWDRFRRGLRPRRSGMPRAANSFAALYR